MKATHASQVRNFSDIPNIGPAMARDFALLGLQSPHELIGKDPYLLYESLCAQTRAHQDPCVMDVFIAAVRFMEGGAPLPWWAFTEERKQTLKQKKV